jgi:MFS transporter, PHS family, inorganic phosphate transporter
MFTACEKADAIIPALAFKALSEKAGTPVMLWIVFACCILVPARLVCSFCAQVVNSRLCAFTVLTLLLPEVRGRDPEEILAKELRAEREKRAAQGPPL